MTNQCTEPYTKELETAIQAGRRAGAFIRSKWNQDVAMEFKGDVDLVSEVDRGAERIVVDAIRASFPADRIVAEESGEHDGTMDQGRVWYVDPLDGTTNFAHGFPHFCVSIGLVTQGRPAIGVIYEPLREWTFSAISGQGAFLDGHRLLVSKTRSLSQALLATGFPYDRWDNPDNNSHRAVHLLRRCQGLRRAGAAALDLAYVAAGWLDGYWEDRLNSWDVAAGVLLVTEAGGQVTDFKGGTPNVDSGDFVASNGLFHQALLDEVRSAPV